MRPAAAPAAKDAAARTQEGFWVAVLPFKHGGASADTAALAEGLSDAIVTGMSRFPYLRVIARSSTLKYTGEAADVRSIGKELGARYVIEGSVRQAGGAVRIAVQLVDARSGAQLWAETFDRPFSPESVFELQDDLAHRIVSTVADAHGVLPHTLSEALRSRNPEELSPYEAVLRSFGFWERLTAEEFATTLASLERAVQQAPGYSYAWAALSLILGTQHYYGFDGRPDPLGRALQAARKAVDLDPSSHRAHQALAETLFWRKEIQAFRPAAERAVALNPMDGCAVASIGALIAYSGDWERGCALVERVVALNPHHPGWYWFPVYMNAYRKGDYRGALDCRWRPLPMNSLFAPATLAGHTAAEPHRHGAAHPQPLPTCTGVPMPFVADYYAQRAGAGLIIAEGTQPSFAGQGYCRTPGIHTPEQMAAWKRVTDARACEGRAHVPADHACAAASPTR